MTPQDPEPVANGDWLVEFMHASGASRSPFRRAMQLTRICFKQMRVNCN